MGEWLAAYRQGRWRVDRGVRGHMGLSRDVAWCSPRFGQLRGQIALYSGDGWALVQGENVPDLLIWVREGLLGGERGAL